MTDQTMNKIIRFLEEKFAEVNANPRRTAEELLEHFRETKPRGEITLVVAPMEKVSQKDGGQLPGDLDNEALGSFVNWLAEERDLKRKAAAEMAAKLLGVPKGRAYNASLGKEPSGGAG
jgi:16S rRNA C1402 (ribose-2'-O) methylase RsmI